MRRDNVRHIVALALAVGAGVGAAGGMIWVRLGNRQVEFARGVLFTPQYPYHNQARSPLYAALARAAGVRATDGTVNSALHQMVVVGTDPFLRQLRLIVASTGELPDSEQPTPSEPHFRLSACVTGGGAQSAESPACCSRQVGGMSIETVTYSPSLPRPLEGSCDSREAFGGPREVALVERLFESVSGWVAKYGGLSDAEGGWAPRRTVQAYYVSTRWDSLTIWSRSRRFEESESTFHHQSMSDRTYVAQLSDPSVDVADTGPYLDLGGNGFVFTRCIAVRGKNAFLRGAFCIDLALPVSLVEDAIPGASVFRLLAHTSGTGEIRVDDVADGILPTRGETAFWPFAEPLSTSEVQAVVDASVNSARPTSTGLAAFGEVLRVPEPEKFHWSAAYLAAVARDPSTQELTLFLVTQSDVRDAVPVIAIGVVCGALLLFALAVVLVSRQVAREHRGRNDAILRGLPAGVVVYDVDSAGGLIIAGNDRAEEVLRTSLPSLADDTTQQRWGRAGGDEETSDEARPVDAIAQRLASVFCRDVLVYEETHPTTTAGRTGSSAPSSRGRLLRVTLEDVSMARRGGVAIHCVALLRSRLGAADWGNHARDWVELRGAPFISAGPVTDDRYGIVLSISETLFQAMQAHRETRQDMDAIRAEALRQAGQG